MKNIERRVFKVEVRKSEDGRKLRGTAVVFNQLSENLGGFREQIDPGAFEGCDIGDVRCLFNHEDSMVLGRTTSNTLVLTRDASGLQFECDPPDTTYARDLAVSMDRGDIDQCSFSFTVAPGGADWSEDPATGADIRTVKKISRLYDVSIVTYPAYPQTSSEIRSNADILSERRTAGQAAPPAKSGGVDSALRLRKLELAYFENL
jgi:HK97 family phage prohead protease